MTEFRKNPLKKSLICLKHHLLVWNTIIYPETPLISLKHIDLPEKLSIYLINHWNVKNKLRRTIEMFWLNQFTWKSMNELCLMMRVKFAKFLISNLKIWKKFNNWFSQVTFIQVIKSFLLWQIVIHNWQSFIWQTFWFTFDYKF